MNSSAKLTIVTLLASLALGAAAIQGCTVTSGTSDDTDGGTQSSGGTSGNGTSGGTSGTTEQDAGEDAAAAVCEGNKQTTQFTPESCQACLNEKCCAELKPCFDYVPPDDTTLTCDQLLDCLQTCEGDVCDECQAGTTTDLQTAFDAIVECGKGCNAQGCNFE